MGRPRLTSHVTFDRADAIVTLGGTGGHFVIDRDDADAVAALRWQAGTKGYVITTLCNPRRTVRLHRWLCGLDGGDKRQVDHIDGDPRNNRRSNLRIVPAPVQAQNRKVGRNSTSGVRGVSYTTDPQRRRTPWVATIRIGGRQRMLGRYATIAEAAEVVRVARAEHMPYAVER